MSDDRKQNRPSETSARPPLTDEECYRSVINNANFGVIARSLDSGLFFANPACCEMLGYTREEFSELAVEDFTHPEDMPLSRQLFVDLVHGRIDEFNQKKRYVRKDGSILYGDVHVQAVRGPNDEFLHSIAVLRDITKDSQASEGQQHMFRVFLERTPMPMAIREVGSPSFIYVNQRFCEMLGYQPHEVMGQHREKFTFSEDVAEYQEHVRALASGGKDYLTAHKSFRHRDGSEVPARVVRSLVTIGDKHYFVGVAEEMLEVRRLQEAVRDSEERFSVLFNGSSTGLWEVDITDAMALLENLRKSGVSDLYAYTAAHPEVVQEFMSRWDIVNVNEAAVRMYEADNRADLISNYHKTFTARSWEYVRGYMVTLFEGTEVFEIKTRHTTLQGNPVTILIRVNNIVRDKERCVALAWISDVSEFENALEALTRSERIAAETQRIAGLGSFEMRLDLQVLYWSDQMYELWGLDPRLPLTMENWLTQVHPDDREATEAQLRRAINRREPFEMIHRVHRDDRREVRVRTSGEVVDEPNHSAGLLLGWCQDVTAITDRPGEVAFASATDAVIGDVSNELIGILGDTERLEMQLANLDIDKRELADIRESIRRIHATLGQLGSAEPRALSQEATREQKVYRVSGTKESEGDTERGVVLVVDDEAIVRDVNTRALRRAGYRVITACDGREGLALFHAHGAEVSHVLMDVTMPNMGGIEACQEIRKVNARVPVIMCSGQDARDPAERVGASAFLHKPYEVSLLVETLRRCTP